jgi:hypothetical protein
MLLMVGICLVTAHLTYFGIEIGCRQYLRGLFSPRQRMQPAPVMARSSRAVGARQRIS